MVLPWIVYQTMAVILKKGGYTLLVIITGLVLQGTLKTIADIHHYLNSMK